MSFVENNKIVSNEYKLTLINVWIFNEFTVKTILLNILNEYILNSVYSIS